MGNKRTDFGGQAGCAESVDVPFLLSHPRIDRTRQLSWGGLLILCVGKGITFARQGIRVWWI